MPVQKQTRACQRTRFKAFVAIGDNNGHNDLGVKCSKEVATAIRGAIILAKLSALAVSRGYWGNKIGIIDFFLGPSLNDEVLKIMPVQKQTRAGQRARFKAFVAFGDNNGHIGLGVKVGYHGPRLVALSTKWIEGDPRVLR